MLDAAGQIGFNMPLFFETHTGPQYPTQQNNVGNTCGSVAQLGEPDLAKAAKLLPGERPEHGKRRVGFPTRQEPSC